MRALKWPRWLIAFAPLIALALTSSEAHADAQVGLYATGYNYPFGQIPVRSTSLYPSCGFEIENNINRNFDGEPFQSCGWDFFMVHYEGYINLPDHQSIQFMVAADDGGTISIGGAQFGTWNLKGCSWSAPADLSGLSGEQPIDGWFFEYGGGTCFMLAWNIDNLGWEIVPDWAYTTESIPSTTTTTSTVLETTVPATTTTSTTLQETSTSTSTSVPQSTSTSQTPTTETTETTVSVAETTVPTTSTSSTSTPATSTTQAWVPPPPVATSEPSTTAPEVSTTVELPPLTTEPSILDTPSIDPEPETSDLPSTTEPEVATTNAPAESATTAAETTTTLPDLPNDMNTPEFTDAEAEAARALVDEAISDGLTEEIVAALAADPAVIQNVTVEQAAVIFETLNDTPLTDEQIEAVTEALNDAPDEIKQEFEEQVNIFSNGFDNYVPLGSHISVKARRVLIASSALLSAVPSVRAEGTSRRRKV